MAKVEKAVFTNMCMVTDGDGNVLVQDRADQSWPGIVFPGGHVEPGESFTASVIREVREETGLTVEAPHLCGVKQFWFEDGTRYVVFLYTASAFSGTLRSSAEGEAFWLPRAELFKCRVVESFPELVRVFENETLSEVFWDDERNDWAFA